MTWYHGAAKNAGLATLFMLMHPALLRPLPDKNELANSCYFTYRVGYIICDPGLDSENAKADMDAGKCNEDFRLMASDYQRRVVGHYTFGGRPPLEESMWLLSSPENFQLRTLKECSPMQVIGYLLLAETKLFVHGPEKSSAAFELASSALQQARQVTPDVYSALERTWPMEAAFQRFQATALQVRNAIQKHESHERPYEVHFVLCHCETDLQWVADMMPQEMNRFGTMFSYSTCADQSLANFALSGLEAVFATVHAFQAAEVGVGMQGECAARDVLRHVLLHRESPPAFTLFLPSNVTESIERNFMQMLLRSLAKRTLDVAFLHLGFRRSPPSKAHNCATAIWHLCCGQRAPRGYEGARFIVSGDRLLKQSVDYYTSLWRTLEEPPGECSGNPGSLQKAFDAAWHAIFGEALEAPLRADDSTLPVFLRSEDGPSGFQGTRLPKTSTYLASSRALA